MAGSLALTSKANMPSSTTTDQPSKITTVTPSTGSDGPQVKGWWSAPAASATTNEYCWSCDNAPSRGWDWKFGYGKCQCEPNWGGACCDEPKDITQVTYGPYMGEGMTYEMYTIDSRDVDKYMIYPDCNGMNKDGSVVPPEFGGLWWMDGNPASDYVASFGASDWKTVAGDGYTCKDSTIKNAQTDEEFECLGGMDIKVYGENVWSWHDESLGRLVYSGALGAKLTYKFECGGMDANGKLTYCQVYPSAGIPFLDGWITVPVELVSFDMTRGDDDLWVRNSIIAGVDEYPHNYWLKNIVTCNGEHGKYWEEYVSDGTITPEQPPMSDVFGNGADTRDKVSEVHHTSGLAKRLA